MEDLLNVLVVAYLVSVGGGFVVMNLLMWPVRKYSKEFPSYLKDRQDQWQVHLLGALERFLYTSSFLIDKPEIIAIWLAFKVINALKQQPTTSPETAKADVSRMNVYLIGNLLTLIFAGSIGWYAKHLLKAT